MMRRYMTAMATLGLAVCLSAAETDSWVESWSRHMIDNQLVQHNSFTPDSEGKRKAGIIWIEAPANPNDRRDASKWTIHDIDSKTPGGYGFKFNDVDGDGDDDIIASNSDWNTADSEKQVVVMTYEGKKPAADNWTTHVLKWAYGPEVNYNWDGGACWRGEKWDIFLFADVDGDGDLDIIGDNCEYNDKGGENAIIGVVWFENPGKTGIKADQDGGSEW